jgi:hypothetical protein
LNKTLADQLFLEFIITNNYAFSLGDEPAFRGIIAALQPLYRPIGRVAVKDNLMATFIKARSQMI